MQWLHPEEIHKLQWVKMQALLKNAYTNVPYYKSLFDGMGLDFKKEISLENFHNIPLLNKECITKNREKLISSKYKPRDLIIDTTSGSTGEKLIFNRDKKIAKSKYNYRDAVVLRNMEWTGANIFDKQVLIWGSQMDISNAKRFKDNLLNLIFPTLILSSYDMSFDMMDSYAKRILKYKPKVTTGYASALYVFADYLEKKEIKIRGLNGIISSAETLYEYQREKIETVFSCKVFNRYGCREFGSIAHECEKHNGLHINDEHVFVEIIDEYGNPCKSGEKGEIIITDLDNHGFPFIRYRTGDLGIFSNRNCSCNRGLSLLENIEGRIFDIVVGTNGNHLTGTFWTILFRTYVNGIKQFQVIQEKYGEIILKLIIDELFTENEKQKMLNRIHEKCGENMKVDIELVDEISLTESGKRRFVISKVSPFAT